MIRQRAFHARRGVAVEGVIDTQFHRVEEPMQVKINAYLSQRRRMALRPFSQVTSASVPSRESRKVLHYFQTLVP
jgi:hypothetical protein